MRFLSIAGVKKLVIAIAAKPARKDTEEQDGNNDHDDVQDDDRPEEDTLAGEGNLPALIFFAVVKAS